MVANYHFNPVVDRLLIRFAFMSPAQWQCWILEHTPPTPDEREALHQYALHHHPAGARNVTAQPTQEQK
jgi:hypothetical protein